MNYYNEIDDKAAAWLRELVSQKLIPAGDVDTRSITEVKAHELKGYTQCHFFAGIGGWPLALQLAGWPADRPVWTGSCPCQPFSSAGKGLAQADERHLWPVFFDLIRQCRPEHVFGEQVASAIGHGWLDGVSADLEAEGYACGATVLGAHSVQSPHQRQRLYWVAHSHNAGPQGRNSEELREHPNQCTSGESSPSDGLAHSSSTRGGSLRSDPLERDGRSAQIRKAEGSDGLVQGCAPCRMDDTRRPSDERRGELGDVGCPTGEEQEEARQRQWSGDADSDSVQNDHGLEQSNGRGCSISEEQYSEQEVSPTNRSSRGQYVDRPSGHFWSDFQFVHCRDGKTRRVPTEPAFQPLAHGVPARVVRLRGYGNAIVPQVAAEFIKAYLEIE